jgi:methionyl-tRNA synthetase
VRYYFLRTIPFGHDGDFTRMAFGARYTADLANDFGNLVQRTTSLASRHSGSRPLRLASVGPEEDQLRQHAATLSARVAEAFDKLALHEAAGAVGSFVSEVNRYVDGTAPWTLARNGESERLELVLDHLVEAARLAAWHYAPIIPRASAEAHCRLAGAPPAPGGGVFDVKRRASVKVGPPLFPRLAE